MTRIRTNTSALALSFGVTALFTFIQVKILTSHLDPSAVGLWATLTSLGLVLSPLAELGLPAVLMRFGAASTHPSRAAWLYGLSFRIVLTIFLALALIVLLTGPWIAALLGADTDRWHILLAYAAVGLGSFRAITNASLRGLRRMGPLAALEIGFSALVTAGYFATRNWLSIPLALAIFGMANLLTAVAGHGVLTRLFSRPAAPSPEERRALWRDIRSFWQGAATGGIFYATTRNLDRPLLAAGLASLTQIALFQVASRIALFARQITQIPFDVMYPETARKWDTPRRAELRADVELFTKLVFALSLLLILVLGTFARSLIPFVTTPEYAAAAPVLWVLLGGFLFASFYAPIVMLLRAAGHIWLVSIGDTVWLVLYLLAGTLFLRSGLGIPGFAAGQLVGSAFLLVFVLIAARRKSLPVPPSAFYVRWILAGSAAWGLTVFVGSRMPMLPWWVLLGLLLPLAAAANVILVGLRFFTPAEAERLVTLSGGSEWTGGLMRFFLSWPRRLVPGRFGKDAAS